MKTILVGTTIAAIMSFAQPHQARAWGPEGHAMIAEIAEARLSDAAKSQIAMLLAIDESHAQHLDQIASWADAVRPSRPETGPWHFVDIPLDIAKYDATRDCVGGNCIVQAIQRFASVLRDRSAEKAARLEALKFIVHFVGDVHQPLHCETDLSKFPAPEGDKGGNRVQVRFFDKGTNLHSVWDGGMIENELDLHLGDHFQPDLQQTAAEAKKMNAAIRATDAAAWAPEGLVDQLDTVTVDWANDSHALAQTAYSNLPQRRRSGWEQPYEDEEWPTVERQLQRGGVRLARILNDTLQ
jgi:S1/P1 Nuclease